MSDLRKAREGKGRLLPCARDGLIGIDRQARRLGQWKTDLSDDPRDDSIASIASIMLCNRQRTRCEDSIAAIMFHSSSEH